jgi:hypothetical protein
MMLLRELRSRVLGSSAWRWDSPRARPLGDVLASGGQAARVALYGGGLMVAALVSGLMLEADPGSPRLLFALALVVVGAGIGLLAPRPLLYGLMIWLAYFGLFRRLLSVISPYGKVDPLLIVAPLAAAVVVLAAEGKGAYRGRTRLATLVVVLSILMIFAAFNPLQKSVSAGIAALIFVLVPTFGFWAGRAFGDDETVRRVLLIAFIVAIAASIYGLAQTFIGFPSWDEQWIEEHGYTALNVHASQFGIFQSTFRPFASFASAAEYSYVVALGCVLLVASRVASRRFSPVLTAGTSLLLLAALLFQSSRGVVVVGLGAVILMIGASKGARLPAAALLAAFILLLLPLTISAAAPARFGQGAGSTLALHQVQGLANPLDPKQSTLPTHWHYILGGLRTPFSEPLGVGIAPISIAGVKLSGTDLGSESDPSNLATALGFPGLFVYIALFVVAMKSAYALARRRRDVLSLAALGLLTVSIFQWLNGGQYFISFLVWFVIGWIDRSSLTDSKGDLDADEQPHAVA